MSWVLYVLYGSGFTKQRKTFVGRFDHQRDAVFALITDWAGAVAVPLQDPAIGGTFDLDRYLVGLARCTLHIAHQQPIIFKGSMLRVSTF